MKHVFIHWTATNQTSILTDAFVRDKSMLQDPKKEGMVLFGKQGMKPPKSGWKAYLGRVIAVSGEFFYDSYDLYNLSIFTSGLKTVLVTFFK